MSAVLILILSISFAGVMTISPTGHALAAGSTHYLDVNKGSDSNNGSQAAPWKTIAKATSSIASGDIVILAAGIYRSSSGFNFGPAGKPGTPTIFKAASGARVILTGGSDEAVSSSTPDYFRVESLWFGGKYAPNSSATPQFSGTGKEIINCTFFGFWQGPLFGWTQDTLFQGNRLIDNGGDLHHHADYFSSGAVGSGQLSNHMILDHNIVIGGLGYGLHLEHGPKNAIVTRNFVAAQGWGSYDSGSDDLWLNNFYWKEVDLPPDTSQLWGAYVADTNAVYNNNVFGPAGGYVNNQSSSSNIHDDYNAFSTQNVPGGTSSQPHGKGHIVLTAGQEQAQIGLSAAQIDSTIASIKAAFKVSGSRTVTTLFNDSSIEPLFGTITSMRIPAGSPLYQTGYRWQGANQPLDIGFNVPAPTTKAGFWNAFRAYANQYGFREYNNYGYALGTGQDVIGVYHAGTFKLRLSNSSGSADISVAFGSAGMYPVVGDWTGQGIDTIGVYDRAHGNFSLRNSNTPGSANEVLTLGNKGDQPLAGRWSKTATHSGVGVFRPTNGLIYLKNVLTTGFADYVMVLGNPGDIGIAGDWTGKGYDTPGVFRPSKAMFYLSDKTSGTVFAEHMVAFGASSDLPVVGAWTGLSSDGIGSFRSSTGMIYLKNTLSGSNSDASFAYGQPGDVPVAGHWVDPASAIAPAPASSLNDSLIAPAPVNATQPPTPTSVIPPSSFDG